MKRIISTVGLALVLAVCAGVAGCSSASPVSSQAAASGSAAQASLSEPAEPAESSGSLSSAVSADAAPSVSLEDGVYEADVSTNSSMFHLNETSNGKGELTVAGGVATVHITLVSKKIVNLYAGTAEQAEADEANWIQPTTDTVTYDDGATKEVYGFDIPVSVLDEPFDVAILGSKGKWYDHTVTVANPVSE